MQKILENWKTHDKNSYEMTNDVVLEATILYCFSPSITLFI